MAINVMDFAGVVPGGSFFRDPRLPPAADSTGDFYAPVRGGTATGNTGVAEPGVPSLPDYSQIDDLIAQINATNQAAQHSANLGRVPGAAGLEAQSSAAIADLFDPDANLPSVNMDAAAAAVGSGTVGSPFAGITGLRRRDDEITRRQALARQMLNAAYAGNPAAPIADPQALAMLLQQQGFAGGQNAAQRALQLQLAQMERNTALAIAAMRNAGSHGSGSHGSGGPSYYGPRIPTGYGRSTAGGTYRAGIDPYAVTDPGATDWYGAGVENPFFGSDPGDVPFWYTGDPSALSLSPLWFPGGPGAVPFQYPGDPTDISGWDFWNHPPQAAAAPQPPPMPHLVGSPWDDYPDYA